MWVIAQDLEDLGRTFLASWNETAHGFWNAHLTQQHIFNPQLIFPTTISLSLFVHEKQTHWKAGMNKIELGGETSGTNIA